MAPVMTAELVPVRPVATDDRAAGITALVVAFLARWPESDPTRDGRPHPTRKAYAADLASWLGWCDRNRVDPLAARHAAVLAWLGALAERREAESTRARRLAAVGSWYRWLIREQVVTVNPTTLTTQERPTVDRDHSTTPVLSADQARALLTAADTDGPRSAAIVAVLLYGGLRVGELLGANMDSVGMDRGLPVLHVTGKGRKQRTVPLPPPVFGRLNAYLTARADLAADRLPTLAAGSRPARPLFVTATGRRVQPQEVCRTLRRLARAAGLNQVADTMSPHSLRHTFITAALDAGVALADVQDAAGHADPRTTRRYDRRALNPDRHPAYALMGVLDTTRPASGHDPETSGKLAE